MIGGKHEIKNKKVEYILHNPKGLITLGIILVAIALIAGIAIGTMSRANGLVADGTDKNGVANLSLDPEVVVTGSIEDNIELDINVLSSLPDPYSAIATDIEKLKAGDKDTVTKYFGESEIFTTDTISDRVYPTIINFVSQEQLEDSTTQVVVHVCTIDYPSMNSDYITAEEAQLALYNERLTNGEISEGDTEERYKDIAKKEVTRKLISGDYKRCYNISIIVQPDSTVSVSETFKQAITGNWYSGAGSQLTPVECIVYDDTIEDTKPDIETDNN